MRGLPLNDMAYTIKRGEYVMLSLFIKFLMLAVITAIALYGILHKHK